MNGDKGYDADSLRKTLPDTGTNAIFPRRRNRKHAIQTAESPAYLPVMNPSQP